MPANPNLIAAVLLAAAAACTGMPEEVGQTEQAWRRQTVDAIYTISYAPNSFVIGNVYPGWTIDVEGSPIFQHGPGNPNGVYYQLGFIYGESFDHCGYIDRDVADGRTPTAGHRCSGTATSYDTDLFLATYTHDGTAEGGAGDGAVAHMNHLAPGCRDTNGYGNVAPWRVPATPANSVGQVPDRRLLKRRYVSRDGRWVLVHDPTHDGSTRLPNWYFVESACVTP